MNASSSHPSSAASALPTDCCRSAPGSAEIQSSGGGPIAAMTSSFATSTPPEIAGCPANASRLHCSIGLRPSDASCFGRPKPRSEEHTSELQSLMRISYAVFCLKKNTHTNIKEQNHHDSK